MLIDGYEDLVEVGRGASAVVYRARQTAFDRIVALKVLGTTALDDASRRRFDRECRALGTLGWHPRVVPVFDAGISASGHPYLVMEYLPEGSVADRLRSEGALDPSDVVAIGIQTGDALEAAHRIGVLHRDVKPGNLLVGHFGGIKLADFGIAAVTSANTSVTDALAGTLSFMAPEILQGKKATPSSDVYSLGSTLFTLLTATTAFSSPTDESPFAALMRVVNDPLPNLRDTGTPDEVAAVVEAAMAKDPADRYDSAAALVAALHQVASRYGWPEEATYADRPPVSTKPAPPGGAAENPTSVADASTVVRPSGAVAGATASLDGLDEPTVLRRDEPGPRRDADRIEPQPAPEPAPEPGAAPEPGPGAAAVDPEVDPVEPAPAEPDPSGGEPFVVGATHDPDGLPTREVAPSAAPAPDDTEEVSDPARATDDPAIPDVGSGGGPIDPPILDAPRRRGRRRAAVAAGAAAIVALVVVAGQAMFTEQGRSTSSERTAADIPHLTPKVAEFDQPIRSGSSTITVGYPTVERDKGVYLRSKITVERPERWDDFNFVVKMTCNNGQSTTHGVSETGADRFLIQFLNEPRCTDGSFYVYVSDTGGPTKNRSVIPFPQELIDDIAAG